MGELDDYLTRTLRAAPELGQTPWAAVPVAKHALMTGDDVALPAQATGHTTNVVVHRKAVERHKANHGNLWDRAVHWATKHRSLTTAAINATPLGVVNVATPASVKKLASDAVTVGREHGASAGVGYAAVNAPVVGASVATQGAATPDIAERMQELQGAPLREVQHQYRALRDIYQTKGIAQGLLETAILTGGGVAGGYFGGKPGAVLGGEAALGVSERTLHPDSWERTANGEGYRDGAGRLVSPGRDVARVLGLRDGTLPYGAVSAVGDGLFDLAADPLASAAGIYHSVANPSTVLRSAADVDTLLAKYPDRVGAAFDDMARKQAAEIARDYKPFQSLARDLGQASTRDEVADVFRDALQGPELIGHSLPTGTNGGAPAREALTSALDDNPIGRLRGAARRVTTKIPMNIDPDTLKFSASRIDPARNDNFAAVRAALKFGNLSDRVIDGVMNDYINATDTGARRLIFRNAMVRSVLSTGVDEDSQLVQRLRQEITDQMGGISGAEGAHYGFNVAGHDLSALPTDNGGRTTAAIYQGQRGDLALPEFKAWTRAIREAQGAKALYGRLDDWAFRRIMVPFKALNLLTGGFALRVSTAELIPAVLRNGVINTIRSSAATRAASFGQTLAADETGHIEAAVVKLLRGPAKFLARDEDVRLATDLVMANNGHVVAPAVRAGDFVTNDAIGKLEAQSHNIYALSHDSPVWRETSDFRGFGQGERDQPLYWQRAIREAATDEGAQRHASAYKSAYEYAKRVGASNDEAVKLATRSAIRADEQWLREGIDPAELSDFTRSLRAHDPDADPILEFARTRVEATKGLSHAPTLNEAGEVVGTPHIEILEHIARGETPGLHVLEGVDLPARPYAVKGRVRVPDTGGNMIEKLANLGFHRVLDPIINTVGREHQYLLSVKKFMANYDGMIASGQITRDEALMHSQISAIQDVARFIHNPSERSQFSVLVRNLAPFWFAQEQSYARAGRLLAEDPAAFRRYQLMVSAFTDYVHEQKDAQGMAHFVIPGLGFLDETGVAALGRAGIPVAGAVPTQVLGNVDSLQTVFPFSEGVRPSFSVFVTVPAHVVENLFPETRPVVTEVIGEVANSGSVWDQLMPSTPARNLVKAFSTGPTVASGAASVFQSLAYQQNVAMHKWLDAGHKADDPGAPRIVPPADASPMEVKEFIEKVRNQARINQIFRAMFSAVTPAAPTIEVGDYDIKEELQRYIDKYGYADGVTRYLEKNPNATPYTITRTKSPGEAPTAPATAAAQQFITQHLSLFKEFPAAAGYLVPQDGEGKFNSAVYQEQIALGLRERKGLDEFVKEFYINEGFAQYDIDSTAHKQAVAELGDDEDAVKAENANWSAYEANVLAKQNPVWWDYFTSTGRDNRRAREIAQLRRLVTDKRVAQTRQVTGIRELLDDLDTHLQVLDNGRLDGWSTEDRQSEVDNWQSYLEMMSEKRPDLSLVISRLFKHEGAR